MTTEPVALTTDQLRSIIAAAYSQGAYDITRGKWGSYDDEAIAWSTVRVDELLAEMVDDYPGCERDGDCSGVEILHHPSCVGGAVH